MADHGIGIAMAIIMAVVTYIGFKYIMTRVEKAEAHGMEDIFARYNPETGIVEDVSHALSDNGCAFHREDNKWPIVSITRKRGAVGPPSWSEYQQAMERFKLLTTFARA